MLDDLEQGCLGGVVLFRRNVESSESVCALLQEIRDKSPDSRRPLSAVDQEGGRVIRLKNPFTQLPPASCFRDRKRPELATLAGKVVGRELRAAGFTMNFAPVLDIDTYADSPVIGDRSYGKDVKEVIRYGLAFAGGLRDGGVFPCAKHFPGHGDAKVDSHLDLPVVEHDEARLNEVEMEPFAAWARTGLGPVMTAHVRYPALDLEHPATMSRRIIDGILRKKFRFKGAVLTDDLEMGAIVESGSVAGAAVDSVNAGADGLLICSDMDLRDELIQRLRIEAKTDMKFLARLKKAAFRVGALAYPAGADIPSSYIGSLEHSKAKEYLAKALVGCAGLIIWM